MRATSKRRKVVVTPRQYLGDPGQRITHANRHDYTGDEPAFICERCGARVREAKPRHAPGGGRAKPWEGCGDELIIATDEEMAMPNYSERQARERRLVTIRMVANRFHVTQSAVSHMLCDSGPKAVGRLEGTKRSLYSGVEVMRTIKNVRPYWITNR